MDGDALTASRAPGGQAAAPQKQAAERRAAQIARDRKRDPRLDFFRGLGMFIILTAHIGPWNPWILWIPARFGWSDATEIFVFCSGAASAIAFAKVFNERGWWIGASRVAYRIWQIYWCHVAVFIAVTASLVWVDANFDDLQRSYAGLLNLGPFLNDPGPQLIGLLTLTYVPNYFDILVMYIVVLALMPVVMGLSWIRPWIAMTFCVALWALTSQPWLALIDVPVLEVFNLPAEPWSERTWFFNPFAWQLVFFTGFAFSLGWLPRPPVNRLLIGAALAVVLITIPFAWHKIFPHYGWIKEFRAETAALHSKTFFGLFRYVHFLALAYLAWVAAGENGARLPRSGLGGRFVTVVRRVGQQSLAVFIFSLVIARLIGAWFYEAARPIEGVPQDYSALIVAAGNVGGYLLLIGVAYGARYFRNPPWKA